MAKRSSNHRHARKQTEQTDGMDVRQHVRVHDDSGIYMRYSIDLPPTRDGIRAGIELLARQGNIDGALEQLETEAMNILAKYQAWTTRTLDTEHPAIDQIEELRPATEWPHELPKDATGIAWDARYVMIAMRALRDAIAANRTRDIMWAAFRLGALAERMSVRPVEPDVRRGRRCIEGARKGHMTTYGTKGDRDSIEKLIVSVYSQERAKHSQTMHVYRAVKERLYNEHNIRRSVETIRKVIARQGRRPMDHDVQ